MEKDGTGTEGVGTDAATTDAAAAGGAAAGPEAAAPEAAQPSPPAPPPPIPPQPAPPQPASAGAIDAALRARLLASPELILADRDLMRALIGAREAEVGANVIDIRGRAMEALESRLSRLEHAHESVIAAAYDNQSGMQTIHRAVISLLEPEDFAGFLDNLTTTVAPILRIDTLRLVMETTGTEMPDQGGALLMAPTGSVARLIAAGRRAPRGDDIILRRASPEIAASHGFEAGIIRSEALLPLNLGPGRWPALLLMGSADPARFTPMQGTDLLRFFAQVFRLVLIGWLRE